VLRWRWKVGYLLLITVQFERKSNWNRARRLGLRCLNPCLVLLRSPLHVTLVLLPFDCNSTATRPFNDLRYDRRFTCQCQRAAALLSKRAVRVATRYAPPLSSPVGAPAPRAPPSRRNVAVVSHAQHVLTVTAAPASRVKAAVSKAAWWPWPLTFWPWKWCSKSRVTWAISLPILVFLCLSVLELGPMYATDRRQTKAPLNVPAY